MRELTTHTARAERILLRARRGGVETRDAELEVDQAVDAQIAQQVSVHAFNLERGTAFAVIHELHERDLLAEVLPVETRPLLQGARLTAWELQRIGADFRLIVDSAGPFLLSRGYADVVLAGADRIAANGDTANKIGTFSLALGAARAGVPFIVVAPESTVDMSTASGDEVEIEDRGAGEITSLAGVPIAPTGTDAVNPAFDVTPVSLITAIVTDRRVVRLDRGESLVAVEGEPA